MNLKATQLSIFIPSGTGLHQENRILEYTPFVLSIPSIKILMDKVSLLSSCFIDNRTLAVGSSFGTISIAKPFRSLTRSSPEHHGIPPKLVQATKGPVYSMLVHRNILIASGYTTSVWEIDQNKDNLNFVTELDCAGAIYAFAIDISSSSLFASGEKGVLHVFDTQTWRLRQKVMLSDHPITRIVLSKGVLYFSSGIGQIGRWKMGAVEVLIENPSKRRKWISSFAIDSSGNFLIALMGSFIAIYLLSTKLLLKTVPLSFVPQDILFIEEDAFIVTGNTNVITKFDIEGKFKGQSEITSPAGWAISRTDTHFAITGESGYVDVFQALTIPPTTFSCF